MAELLKLESRPSDFTLQWVDEKKPVRLGDLLRKWRVVLLFLSEDMYAENDVAESYLKFMRDAKVRFGDLAKRDVTLCVIHPYVRSRSALPSPTDFQVLNDPDGKVAAMYGGAPAFYLIGKDGGIKEARRTCPPLAELLGTIDKMPMRKQERRERSE